VSDPDNASTQPPADALLWRVEGLHHEVVCYVVASDTGVVLCVASDGENDLLVAESHPTLADAIKRASVLRASLTARVCHRQARSIRAGLSRPATAHFDFTLAISPAIGRYENNPVRCRPAPESPLARLAPEGWISKQTRGAPVTSTEQIALCFEALSADGRLGSDLRQTNGAGNALCNVESSAPL
jgi:hypothetical protein